MATYYLPPRTRSVSRTSSVANVDINAFDTLPLNGVGNDLADQSIYIFPNPTSVPPTPGGSVISAPTEFDYSFESRSTSLSGPLTCDTFSRRRRESTGSKASSISRGMRRSSHDHFDIDVEIWDVESEASPDAVESEGSSWALEGVTDLRTSPDFETAPSRSFVVSTHEIDATHLGRQRPLRYRKRSQTHSRIRTSSLSSLSRSSPSEAVPHPRIHLPLISFFTSIFRIDMDDPAVRLLTCGNSGETESVLFPGHGSISLVDPDGIEPGDLQAVDRHNLGPCKTKEGQPLSHDGNSEIHGLPKLLLAKLSDQSTVAIQTLRVGLAARIVPSSGLGLAVPRTSDLVGLWTILGGIYASGGRAWKELWRAQSR
ncbi:hypothetical protein FKP32DRAFT_1260164 [Trametes sanguinea]|nr:hypothetical protein FKP32DRAFT_1260164 [Trametes sanguinea]